MKCIPQRAQTLKASGIGARDGKDGKDGRDGGMIPDHMIRAEGPGLGTGALTGAAARRANIVEVAELAGR